MKKLFVSLLRLGDVIMQKPLIEAAGVGHEIHILINDEFAQLAQLYPQFKFHLFPRKYLQTLINRPETSLLAPFEELRYFMTDLNKHGFREAVNLTHTKLSAYVMDQIEAPVKRGLEFQKDRFKAFDNSAQKYFNETFSGNTRSQMHYLASLAKSLELAIPRLKNVEDRRNYNTVYLQVLTSDSKKNWDLQNWQELAVRLAHIQPEWNIKVLCADFEVEKIKGYFSDDQIEVASLLEVREKLGTSRLLITGDTSIAHLAAETCTPAIILSLGSSDYTKTMPWIHGHWILTAEIGCAPCPHGSQCSQALHECAEAIRVTSVLSVVNGLERDQFAYSLAQPEVLYRTEFDTQVGMKTVNYSNVGGQDVSKHTNVL